MKKQRSASAGGRPRDPEANRRILDATLRLLEEQGYSRMSIDAVAEAAGASKPTIYRRWPGKAELVMAALTHLRVSEPSSGLRGRGRLREVLLGFRKSLLRPNGMALVGTVLAEEGHTPELLALFRRHLVEPRRAMVREALAEAIADGELAPGTDLDVLANLLVGSFYGRYLAGQPIPPTWVDQILDAVVPVRVA